MAVIGEKGGDLSRGVAALALLVFGLAGTLGVFNGGAFAAIGLAGAVLLWGAVAAMERRVPRPDRAFFVLCFLSLGGVAALDFQAAWPRLSAYETLRLATVFLPLLLFSCAAVQARVAEAGVLFKFWPWLLAAAMLVLGVEYRLGLPLMHAFLSPERAAALHGFAGDDVGQMNALLSTGYNRGLSYAMLLSWPVAAYLAGQQRWKAAVFVLCLVPALYLTSSRAAQLAVVVGLGVWGVACVAPRLARVVLGIFLVACVAWPLGAQWVFSHHQAWLAHLPYSWLHRSEIWDFMSYRIQERPWLGWGVGSSHLLLPALPHGDLYVFAKGPVGHPHNAFVQLWVELGVLGPVLGLGFAFVMLQRAARLPVPLVPFGLGAFTAALALALVAYDFWADSLWAVFVLTAFGFAVVARRVRAS